MKASKKGSVTTHSVKPTKKVKRYMQIIRDCSLALPEAKEEDFCGQRSAFKVKNKVFVFMGVEESKWRVGFKLKESRSEALGLPFSEPTHGGLGKHGWVTARFGMNEPVPITLIKKWINESFHCVAPQNLLERTTKIASSRSIK